MLGFFSSASSIKRRQFTGLPFKRFAFKKRWPLWRSGFRRQLLLHRLFRFGHEGFSLSRPSPFRSYLFTRRAHYRNLRFFFRKNNRKGYSKFNFYPFGGFYSSLSTVRYTLARKRFRQRFSLPNFFGRVRTPIVRIPFGPHNPVNVAHPLSVIVKIVVKYNNIFYLLFSPSGRLLFNYSNGQTIFRGSKRNSPVASEFAGRILGSHLRINRFENLSFILSGPSTSQVRSFIKSLIDKLNVVGISYTFRSVHGTPLRAKSTRRV